MARTSISIPDDLKARMDAVGERVNWSEIGARAFEEKLGEIASRKKRKNMKDIIQRLKASKLEGEDQEYKDGHRAGHGWAEHRAQWHELERLAEAVSATDFFSGFPDHMGWAGVVLRAMNPRAYEEMRPSEREAFWKEEGNPNPSEDWLRGFCDGAIELFGKVEDEI